VTPTDIELQVGAAAGLWTHTPVDWAGNEGLAKPSVWPANAAQGMTGQTNGQRPPPSPLGPWSGGAGFVSISNVSITALAATTASIQFTLSSLPTVAARVNYGTTTAVGSSTAAGSAASGTQTINLSGLTTKTTYYYQVSATNANGSTLTQLFVFTTA
jgi:hypothetical protein